MRNKITTDDYKSALSTIKLCVLRQAEDEGLWIITRHGETAYIQKELRRLHAIIEDEVRKCRI